MYFSNSIVCRFLTLLATTQIAASWAVADEVKPLSNHVSLVLDRGGFSQPVSRRAWLLFEILYEVIQDSNSPYDGGGPIISVGFGVGF